MPVDRDSVTPLEIPLGNYSEESVSGGACCKRLNSLTVAKYSFTSWISISESEARLPILSRIPDHACGGNSAGQ